MRTASTLAGLVLLGVAATARAQEVAPLSTVPLAEPSVSVQSPLEADSPAHLGKVQLGASFLSMGLGKMTQSLKGVRENKDALFAYGIVLTADYRILPGLTVGIAPQAILNVKAKDSVQSAARQIDLLARLAYAYRIAEGACLYAEVLPGYSLIVTDDLGRGMVIAVGLGAAVDLSARTFAHIGLGYQKGFQKFEGDDDNTTYVRASVGVGMRF